MDVHHGIERRRHARIYAPFRAIVRGVETSGESFELSAILDNLSARGLSMRLARHVETGAKLFVVVRFSTAPTPEEPAPRVAMRGVVLRTVPQPEGTYGVAVVFTRHRFLR